MLKKNIGKKVFLVFVFMYLFIPILATILFSITDKWDTTILPEHYTLVYYRSIFSDSNFVYSLIRTVSISVISSILSIVVLVPCIYLATLHYKKMEKLFELLVIIPFVMPGVVLAIGLIEMYSNSVININGTIWILLGAYFVMCFPFMYQSIRNSFRGMEAKKLVEAAMILGYSEFQAFIRVIVPNIIKGLISALLLSISILFGEFVLVNLLVGTNFNTVQMYLYNVLSKNGHTASAVVSVYLIAIFIISFIAVSLSGKRHKRGE